MKMSDFKSEKDAMHSLTNKYMDKLASIWEHLFDPDTCRENLRKLICHATDFYDGLVVESLSRKTFVENEIHDMKKEAFDLKRMLNTNIQLPSFETSGLPLVIVHSELDKSLEQLREQLKHRKEEICELLLQQDTLCEELGEQPLALPDDPLPTAAEINNFRKNLEDLRDERLERLNKVATLRKEIVSFLEILELEVNTEHDDRLINQHDIKLNKKTVEDLEQLHSLYGIKVCRLEETVKGMRKKLDSLWDRLETSPNTRNKFKRYKDCSLNTYNIFEGEIQRCETLKKQNVKLFVQQIREEIAKMWEKTLKSETQKCCFSSFTSTCYSDDLLLEHEMELEALTIFYETNKPIFELFADRNILCVRMNALEAKSSDPGRYNNRGGQLLKEEKERKSIATKLQKIEKQILELVQKYEEREHSPFLAYGVNIVEYIASRWDNKRHEKEQVQSARKNGKVMPTSSSKTKTSLRTPLSMKNTSSASSLGKTPSTISSASKIGSSQKRKIIPSDKDEPMAKRSLMQDLKNSSTAFLKPGPSNGVLHTNSENKTIKKRANNLDSSPSPYLKKPKLIATTIRRRSGNLKKRRSYKKTSAAETDPKIVAENWQSNDTYSSFQKCIEPASHSSVIEISASCSNSACRQYLDDENEKLKRLPRPPVTSRTLSKKN